MYPMTNKAKCYTYLKTVLTIQHTLDKLHTYKLHTLDKLHTFSENLKIAV